jgi:tetratricopeptide (TPR) repeat protein
MKMTLIVLISFIAGCASFEPAYNDVNSYQRSRDSERCVERAKFYLGNAYFTDNQKSELYNLMGICFSQIGFYDEAISSLDSAVNVTNDMGVKSKAMFQRSLLFFSNNNKDNYMLFVEKGCTDIAEACRLMPDKYCSEYNIKKSPPTNCK